MPNQRKKDLNKIKNTKLATKKFPEEKILFE
jgi:hypothetical protein